MNNSHLTALTRKKLSTPMKWLSEQGLIKGRALDYGCGKGFDANTLDMEKYDRHFCPYFIHGLFDTITCNYVLNVIPDRDEQAKVVRAIWGYLAKGGTAYITVRADKKKLNGYTDRGTWQGYVELPLEEVRRTASFVIYKLQK